MKAKALEIRDRATFVPMLCVDMNPRTGDFNLQRYLLRRCGYPCDGRPNILMTSLNGDGGRATNDPPFWNDRTRAVAHEYIIDNWHELRDGDVIDVEFILGETSAPKKSEREEFPV